MKKFLMILFLSVSFSYSQNLNLILSPQIKETMKDIFFINSSTGWLCGAKGTIYKTTDSGINWTLQYSDSLKDMSKIFFINSNTGWIASNNSSILKTTNGGVNWTEYNFANSIPNVILTFTDAIHFTDLNNGFITCGKAASSYTFSYVLKTTDSGVSWTKKDSLVSTTLKRRWYALDINGVDGVLAGDQKNIEKYSSNFGETWSFSTAINDPFFYMLKYVKFLNTNDVIALGEGNEFYSIPTPIYKSTDKGINWIKKNLSFTNKYDRIKDAYFKDGINGIGVGSNGFGRIYIVKTTDAGETWNYSTADFAFGLQALAGVNNDLYALGTGSHIIKSNDFGNTWQLIPLFTPSSIVGIQFIGGKGFSITRNGDLYISLNSGKKWNYLSNAGRNNSGSMIFQNANIGFILKENRHIVKTTDGGSSWRTVLTPVVESSRNLVGGITFADNNTGYAWMSINDYGSHYVFKSTNGGENWDSLAVFSVDYISGDVVAFDANNVVLCGPKRWTRRTSNGGISWDSSSFNNFPVNISKKDFEDVAKVNSTKAFAVGSGFICVTTDKGVSWNYINHGITLTDSSFYVVSFLNESIGYVGLYYGGILRTTDGGLSWNFNSSYSEKHNFFSSAFNENGKIFFGTSNGEILGEEIPNSINETPAQIAGFKLEQNYPNPFNPSTTLKYSIPVKCHVILKIFDVLGKEILTLVNAEKDKGEYSISFNATSNKKSLSAGIYFYQLHAGDYLDTKKFIILK
jgi:photosystem II stability/assembly factor-like uncharacterized protein